MAGGKIMTHAVSPNPLLALKSRSNRIAERSMLKHLTNHW